MKAKKINNQITKNKKAYFDYEIIDSWETWIELFWYETKSIRNGAVNLKWAFIVTINNELYIKWMHITAWKALSNRWSIETKRERKIFLHKKTIIYLSTKAKQAGNSIIPLELYFSGSLIKLRIWLVKWKKVYQKKQILKERSMDRESSIMMKKII